MLPIETVVAELHRLDGGPALSAYLRTDGFSGVQAELGVALAGVLKPVREHLPWRGPAAAAFEREVKAVEARLPSVVPGQRGVALFSCSRHELFRWVPLDVPLAASAHWGERFALKPLLSALDRAERVLFLLLSDERVRLFRTLWGEIEEVAPPPGIIPRADLPPASAPMGRAAAIAAQVARSERVDRLLAGGDPAVVGALRELLPAELAQRLEACGALPADAAPAQVLEVVLERLWRTQRERDDRLVEELLCAVARGQAAVGPGAVAKALAVGDVGRLVVPEGLHLGGGECPTCGMLAPAPMPHFCPACGGPLRIVPDLIERIEARVTRGGGSVDEVGGHAAATLAEHEAIGAFLRLPPVPAGG